MIKKLLNFRTHKIEQFQDLIDRIWIMEIGNKEIEITIPPNQYNNLIIPLSKSGYTRNNSFINKAQIEGISTRNTTIIYPPKTRLIGIRFYAFGLYPFIQKRGKTLLNNSIDIELKSQNLDPIIEHSTISDKELICHIKLWLENQYSTEIHNTLHQIISFYKQFRWGEEPNTIEEYCKSRKTNYTTLNRLFTLNIGISPKKFERLIKFRRSLCHLLDSESRLTSIASESGYFDQSHFIREFKLFVDCTPSRYQRLLGQRDPKRKKVNYNFRLY